MINNIAILGVGISQITKISAVKTVSDWLLEKSVKPYFIVTPNPEMLVLAQKDKEFKDVLNRSDLAIPDGIGLVLASSNKLNERVSGTDLMLDLCRLADQKGYTVGLLGAGQAVAQKTAEVLKREFPGIKIKFAVSEISDLLPQKSTAQCDFLFVAFGAPKQEKFLWNQVKIKNKNINFKVGMGVGGAFDLISGKIKRAPKVLQDFGLEWLWRLIQEPTRIKRILIATIVFPLLVLKYKVWPSKNP